VAQAVEDQGSIPADSVGALTEPLQRPALRSNKIKGATKMSTRRKFLAQTAAVSFVATTPVQVATAAKNMATEHASTGSPDPLLEKPSPLTTAALAKTTTSGVAAFEVNDYTSGHYTGALTPCPPHADLNPKKAVVVIWKDNPSKFVFSHEASYCPILELPDGSGMGNQFFEGNLGNAELFNSTGRREKNSSVDIVESGHERVWVRWNYQAVHKDDDSQPRLRGTEDYFAYPNGLVLRRATYESLMPNDVVGYSTQPVELYGILPAGAHFKDLIRRDAKHGDYNTLSIVDLYSNRRYDIFWDDKGGVRREGDNDTLAALNASLGVALVIPFRDRLLFAAMGDASGFPPKYNQFVDHCTPEAVSAGGIGWKQGWWDHWPIGWLNSQANLRKEGSPYTSHFGSVGQFFVPEGKRMRSFRQDYPEYVKDMALNRWTAKHVYYVLLGSAKDWNVVRRFGKSWLDQGPNCARPASIADIT
jgi:hypothetical protein